ncbi:hypothetical protein PpBr36_04779 [Pyricularia pennisetigena]|uniref:hypothetical protein n=1 Tax=Pyricularia pennisetigena TaxID=1578925 RepID=UPI00114DEDC4|nr:hypothetical protein PpBr36_04779 [Pyricularia pennisetigena]TLS27161.1 hypothetical protein PpBr36_04779 [Pyricularia pennisetigena]
MNRRSRDKGTKTPGDLSSSSSSSTSTADGMVKVHISDLERLKAPTTNPSRGHIGTWAKNYRRATVEDAHDSSGSARRNHNKTKDRRVHFKPRDSDPGTATRRRRPRDPESWHHSGSSSGDADAGGIDDDARSSTSSDAPHPSPKPIRSALKKPKIRKPVASEGTAHPPSEQQTTAAPVSQQQTGYMLVPGPHPGTQQLVPVQVSTGNAPEHQQPSQFGHDALGMGPAQLLSAQLQHIQLHQQQQGMYGMMSGQALGGYGYPGAMQMGYHPMQYPTCPTGGYPYAQPNMMQAPMQIHYHQQQPQHPMYHHQPGYLAPGPLVPEVEPGGAPVHYSAEHIPAFQAPGMHNMGGYFNN